ncbi:MAG: 2-phosphosulfolactate phosphatase [Bacteroidales bacterium]|nr:2-phosphosulfolactate phosphatase [Bacteroidales bacterium]
MSDDNKYIEVCFSPLLFDIIQDKSAIVVIVDVLRATSAICAAFENGVNRLIPVETLVEAKKFKEKGFLVAAERDGIVRDFADFGNSPFNFTKDRIQGKDIVYSTTNGTQTIQKAKDFYKVVIGSFLNIDALNQWLIKENRNVVILCAGWKGRFNLEDTLFAGALCELLLKDKSFYTECDSAHAALELWKATKEDILGFIDKAAQRHRLKKNKLDDVIPFCFKTGFSKIIPQFSEGYLLDNRKLI